MHAKHADEIRTNALSEHIIGCAFRVQNTLGSGFLEKVYENALAHEMREAGFSVASGRASLFTTTEPSSASMWPISWLRKPSSSN